MNSSEEKTLVSSIHISAAKVLIWDVLLKPEYTKPYMFGGETVSTWQRFALGWRMHWWPKQIKHDAHTTISPSILDT